MQLDFGKPNLLVYIVYSQKRSRYYVGQTYDIENRLIRHNSGLVVSTKTVAPWDLVYIQNVNSRSEALILEKKIKKRGAKRYIEDNQFGV